MAKYRVMSLDGGGIRGVITIVLLQRLRAMEGLGDFMKNIDLFAGTSTGGLLALSLAKGLNLDVLKSLYVDKGADVFDDSFLDDVIDLATIIGAEYNNKKLTRELRRVMGTSRLGDLPGKVLITSFDLDNEDPDPGKRTWKPKLFHNLPGESNDSERLVYKVALYTAAAPTFFPAVDGYIDGGVYANNPAMCALAQTQDPRNKIRPDLSEVLVLSLGTGFGLTHIKGQNLDWGYAQWVKPLISLMMDGVAGVADYQCRQLLGDHYHRLAPVFPVGKNYALDDVKQVNEMVQFAMNVNLDITADWIRANWL